MLSSIQNALSDLKAVLVAGWTTATGGFTVAVVLDVIQLAGAVVAVVFAALINYAIWRKAKAEAELIELQVDESKNRRRSDDVG